MLNHRFIALLSVVFAVTLLGCDKNGDTKIDGTVIRNTPAPTASPTNNQSSSDDPANEAVAKVNACFASYWLNQGDSWFLYSQGTENVWQFKDISNRTIPIEVSKAERLNDNIEWKGIASCSGTAFRKHVSSIGAMGNYWTKWQDCSEIFSCYIEKKNGIYNITKHFIMEGTSKPTEEMVTKILKDKTSQFKPDSNELMLHEVQGE